MPIAMDSFWEGTGEEEFHGLRFTYYSKEQLEDLINNFSGVLR